jgi:hypothetical protein
MMCAFRQPNYFFLQSSDSLVGFRLAVSHSSEVSVPL